VSSGSDILSTNEEENGEYCITVRPVTRTAQSVKGAGYGC